MIYDRYIAEASKIVLEENDGDIPDSVDKVKQTVFRMISRLKERDGSIHGDFLLQIVFFLFLFVVLIKLMALPGVGPKMARLA